MNRTALFMLCAGVVAAAPTDRMLAHGKGDWSFQRVGTFANYQERRRRRRDGFGDHRRYG